jgi:uncharacterized protein (DUF305 family)
MCSSTILRTDSEHKRFDDFRCADEAADAYRGVMPSAGIRFTVALAVLVSAAVVTSCGAARDAPSTEHNAADVGFAQNMIPHHQQAVEMSAIVPGNTDNQKLIVLAQEISSDQQAEIEMLQDLLRQWGEPVTPGHDGHGGHHGHGMAIEGMVDSATMDTLEAITGTDFDELWLESMIRHHQGAIAMARPEISDGESPQAVRMANLIVDWQQYEIARMTSMLSVPV